MTEEKKPIAKVQPRKELPVLNLEQQRELIRLTQDFLVANQGQDLDKMRSVREHMVLILDRCAGLS